jgi:ubiquinone/menaquinone biosynthesis C-methylase UbiE
MNKHFQKDYQYHQIIAGEYDSVIVNPRQVTNALLFRRFSSLVGKGERMIDLGCGTGHMSLRFCNRFSEVIAVDHSDAMLQQARDKAAAAGIANIEFVQSEVLEFASGYTGKKANIVCCTGFLHHLLPGQLPELLRMLFDMTSADGKLLVSEPIEVAAKSVPDRIREWNEHSIVTRQGYLSNELQEPDEAPLDEKHLCDTIADAGYRIVKRHRNWEIYPHEIPPRLKDWINIYWLNRRYGSGGNVFTVLAKKPAR